MTGFVLAEGTHQTRCLFGEFQFRNIDISLTTGGRVPDVTTCCAAPLLTSRPAEGSRPAPPRLVCPPKARLQQLPGLPGRMPYLARPSLSTAVGAVGCSSFCEAPIEYRGKSIQLSRRDTDLQYIVVLGRRPPYEEWAKRVVSSKFFQHYTRLDPTETPWNSIWTLIDEAWLPRARSSAIAGHRGEALLRHAN